MSSFYSIIFPTGDGSFSFLLDEHRPLFDTIKLNQICPTFDSAQTVALAMKKHFPLVDYKIVKCEIAND